MIPSELIELILGLLKQGIAAYQLHARIVILQKLEAALKEERMELEQLQAGLESNDRDADGDAEKKV